MPHVRESKPQAKVGSRRSVSTEGPARGGIAGLQRAIGNRATLALLNDANTEPGGEVEVRDSDRRGNASSSRLIGLPHEGARSRGLTRDATGSALQTSDLTRMVSKATEPGSLVVHRWPWSKTKAPTQPQITPERARDIQNAIAKSPEMKQAEEIRATGTDDAEDKALALIEGFWDTGEVEVDGKKVALKTYKPLMFTPSERRVRQVNKVRLASSGKAGFDKSVLTGRTDPSKAPTPYKAPKSGAPGTGVVESIGSAGSTTSQVAGVGTTIGSHFEDPTTGSNMSLGSKLVDTKYNDPSDPMYGGPPSFESKSDWAGSVIEIVQGAFGIVSGVAEFVRKASDKETTKTEVAESGTGAASTLTSSASSVAEMVQNIQGSDLTTNMFHWIPGLSVLSNGLSAVKSALALVPRAVQLHSLRTNGEKVKSDKQREDVKLAVSRLAVRAAQQVEQESFAVAKSLTKAGLSLAEVVTAGGFGIPRLATVVLDGVGVLHSIGHAIADFVRANATGKARTDYFGAHKEKSAEKLLNTDPAFAADAILTRATESDPQAIAILQGFNIEVPPIGGTRLVKMVTVKLEGNKGSEQMLEYDYDAIAKYDAAKAKLIDAIKPEKTVGETVDQVTNLLTERTEGLATAKRLAEVRNEIGYKNKKDRGAGFKMGGFFKGKSGQQKSVDKTEKAIRESSMPPDRKEALLAKLKGTDVSAPKAPSGDPQVGRPVDNATYATAMKMSASEIYRVIEDGPKAVGGPGPMWEAYLMAYVAKRG